MIALLLVAVVADGPLAVDRPVADLGRVVTTANLSHTFWLTNRSGGAVMVEDVQPACGCLTPKLSATSVSAGETLTVEVTLHTLSQKPGPHRFTTRLYVRGERLAEIPLHLDVELARDVEVKPAQLIVYANAQGEPRDGDRPFMLKLVRADGAEMKVTGTQTSSPLLSAAVAGQDVALTVAGPIPVGRGTERLRLTTDDPKNPVLEVPVLLVREPPVKAYPDRVRLAGNFPATRTVFLRGRTGRPVEVRSLTARPPVFEARLQPGLTDRIDLTFPQPPPEGCRLVVETAVGTVEILVESR